MNLVIERNHFNSASPVAASWGDWVEAYDMLERNWPYSRTRRYTPPLIQIAARFAKRRQFQSLPARQAYASTAAYYDALLPLYVAQSYWERVSNWRYVRPMMIRVMLKSWPRHRR